jgi:hypothetical protein
VLSQLLLVGLGRFDLPPLHSSSLTDTLVRIFTGWVAEQQELNDQQKARDAEEWDIRKKIRARDEVR